jgi:hypothetical protein
VSHVDLDAWTATAERLLGEPYPEKPVHQADGFAEPGLHTAWLMESRDFWDDDAYEAMEPTLRAYEAMRDRLIDALTERWGEPAQINLTDALDRSLRGEQLPPLTEYLCNVAGGRAPLWRRGDRCVSVVVAWEDKELPMILMLAVGNG